MSFFDFLEQFFGRNIDAHHILQKAIFSHRIFLEFGLFQTEAELVAYRDASNNLIALSNEASVAQATETPRHAGPHPWIANVQRELLDNFLTFEFDGVSVADLLDDPASNPAAFEKAKAYLRDQYLPDIRDQTAKGLIDGNLHLTAGDARLPAGTTTANLETNARNYLSAERFGQSDAAAQARQADLADYRSQRAAMIAAGVDERWIAFNDLDKVKALQESSLDIDRAPFNRGSLSADSFEGLVNHVDDGSIRAFELNLAKNKGIPAELIERFKFGSGGVIMIIGLGAVLSADVAQAATKDTVEERNAGYRDAIAAVLAELSAMLLFTRAVPQALWAVGAYLVYKYVTDEEFHEYANDTFDSHVARTPQIVSRLLAGEQVFPSDDDLRIQHVPAPGSRYVPIISGFAPLPPTGDPLTEAGIERYEAFVVRLGEADQIYSLQLSDIGKRGDSNQRYPISVLDRGGIPIGFRGCRLH